jgi:hypothetical protein
MNRTSLSIVFSLSLIACGTAFAADTAKTDPANVTIAFEHPDKFTDVKDGYMATDKGRDGILDDIKEYVIDRGGSYLKKGMRLDVTFTDIDLAGDFEPQLGPRFSDVRIMKDTYPPRLDIQFKITDADGKVLSEGKRELTDLDYLRRLILPSSDPLRYEKDLLNDWLREEIRSAGKARH